MGFSVNDRLPIPPKSAEVKNVTCEFCIVGCGYKAYKWPKGVEGSAKSNALGIDLSKQQGAYGVWASPDMFNVVRDRDGKEFNVMVIPDQHCVVNEGQNSARGGAMGSTLFSATSFTNDRLKQPTVYAGANMNDTTWHDAVGLVAKVIKKVIDNDGADMVSHKTFDHGGGGGGFENTWGTGKLFHTAIGTSSASIHNRPAYNSEVHSTREMGMGELNTSYYDTELADTIFIIGANPYETQTNFFLMHAAKNLSGETLDNKKKEYDKGESVAKGKIIIVDPRITATINNSKTIAGEENVLHLRLRPGTDVTLMNTLLTYIVEKGWNAKEFMAKHTENFDKAYAINKTSLADGAKVTGLSEADIVKCAEWIAKPKPSGHRPRTSIFYEKGIIWGIKNFENVASIANVAFATQSVGRVGTGCCRLGGHQEGYTRPEYHGPSRQNLKVIDEEVVKGNYQVYFAWGCNPFVDSIMAEKLRTAFTKRAAIVKEAIDKNIGADLDTMAEAIYQATKKGGLFFIDIDIYPTLKQQVAHVTLPAVTTMEMNLTSMSGERRMRLSEKVVDGPGSAKPDCLIAADIANALKAEYKKAGNAKMAARFEGFEWKNEEDAFKDGFAGQGAEMASQGGGTGKLATYTLLRAAGNNGVQLPIKKVDNGKLIGTRMLYTDNKFGTKSGKAIFLPTAQPAMPAPVAKQVAKYSFWVHSGRLNEVWQSNFHTSRIEFVKNRWPLAPVEINPADAKALEVADGDLVMLYNDYGSVRAVVNVTESVRPKEVFMAFGFPNSPINNLVTEYVDPDTKIPFYKGTAANIKKIGRSESLIEQMTFKSRI
jgi:arsenite oxidase large subunit